MSSSGGAGEAAGSGGDTAEQGGAHPAPERAADVGAGLGPDDQGEGQRAAGLALADEPGGVISSVAPGPGQHEHPDAGEHQSEAERAALAAGRELLTPPDPSS